MMAEKIYAISMVRHALEADVRINGITITQLRGPGAQITRLPANDTLIRGWNRFEFWLGQADPDPMRTDPPTAEVMLHRMVPYDAPDGNNVMLSFTYTMNECALPENGLMKVVDHRFMVPESYGPFGFEAARPILDADQSGMEAGLRKIHAALVAKDLRGLLAMFSVRFIEGALATGQPKEVFESSFAEEYGLRMAEDDYSVQAINLDRLAMDVRLDGRIAHPRDRSGRPLLRGTAGGKPWALPVSFANLNGTLAVVR